MRVVKLHHGQRRFGIEEFLIPQQIVSTFSRHNRKNDFIREHTICNLEQNLMNGS